MLLKFDLKMTKMEQNYMSYSIMNMNVLSIVCQLIHYFIIEHGLVFQSYMAISVTPRYKQTTKMHIEW